MHDDIRSRSSDITAVPVLLVAHDDLVTESLRRALECEDSVHVVGVVDPHRDLTTAIERTGPEVVIVTAQVYDTEGLQVLTRLHDDHPDVPLLLLADGATGPALGAALKAGCAGFVAWDGGFTELVRAIHTVAEGGVCVPRALAADLVAQMRPAPHSHRDLTDRELEMLGLLARGMSTDEIVEHLTLSVHTVRNHIRTVLAKLGAHSRLEAVAIASRRGLLPTPVAH